MPAALEKLDLGLLYRNTALVALVTLAIEIPITFASAFALARLDYKRGKVRAALYTFMLIGLAISPFILLFPIYRINHFIGLREKIGLVMALYLYIGFVQYAAVRELSAHSAAGDRRSLHHRRRLAGATHRARDRAIARPVLATVIIFNLLYIWNEYPFASIMLNDSANYTLSRGIAFLRGRYSVDYAGIAAYSVMIIVPELILYIIFQRNVMEGMTAGAVKG